MDDRQSSYSAFPPFPLYRLTFPSLYRQSFLRLQPAANRIEFFLQLDILSIRPLYVQAFLQQTLALARSPPERGRGGSLGLAVFPQDSFNDLGPVLYAPFQLGSALL